MTPFDADDVAADAAARAHAAPDSKQPLFRETAPAQPFPVDGLGPLRQSAEAVHILTQAPVALAAQSVLAAATLGVQAHCDVELPTGERKALVNFFLTIAPSGERKTSCDHWSLRAVRQYEERLRQDHDPAMRGCLADKHTYDAAVAMARKKGNGDRAKIRDAINSIDSEPKPPPHPMLLVSDPNAPSIEMHLKGRPWGGVFSDEGGKLIGGWAMSDDNRMATGAFFNSLWDGTPIRRLRVSTGATFLPGRRCSIHLMVQPVAAGAFFGDATLASLGTLARVLMVWPESTAGSRMYRDPDPAAQLALADYDRNLSALLDRTPRLLPDDGGLDPKPLRLSHEAASMWRGFHDLIERQLSIGGALAPILAFASKLPEHAARLAAVLTAYRDPDAIEVSADAMMCGTELAQYYAAEALRIGHAAMVPQDLQLAARLRDWWQARDDPRCHLSMIYQLGPGELRDAATARRIADVLEERGWIRRLPAGTVIDGMGRRECWELVP